MDEPNEQEYELAEAILDGLADSEGIICEENKVLLARAFASYRAALPQPEPRAERQEMRFIDATPDEGYIARILSAYLDDSYYSDNTAGLPPENSLVVQMNAWREQRNALLRAALARLTTPSSEKAPEIPPTTQGLLDQIEASAYKDSAGQVVLRKREWELLMRLALQGCRPAPPELRVPRAMLREIMDEAVKTGSMREVQAIANRHGFFVDDRGADCDEEQGRAEMAADLEVDRRREDRLTKERSATT